MNSLNKNVVLLVTIVVVEQSTVHHDRVVFLRDLVTLGQIWVDIVFPVELNERWNAAAECEGAFNCLIKAVFVQNWKHAWDTQVDETDVGVGLLKI